MKVIEVEYSDEISLTEYVALCIEEIFTNLAEGLSEVDLSEEDAAALPMALFQAEVFMKRAWLTYVEMIGELEREES